mgnify:CR=1 FL=1
MKTTPEEFLAAVRAEAEVAETWADLSNFVFDPEVGILAGVYPTEESRAAFIKTPEFKEIRRLINDVKDRTGHIQESIPKKRGQFVVQLPRSLHIALEAEAKRDGVSLNQLVVDKLTSQTPPAIAG